jgi:O-antigen/teichoic acid export membrane protein
MSDHAAQKRSLAVDTSWLVCAKTVAFGVTFVLPLVMVRQLSQEDFGLYRQLFLPISTAIAILPFGFAMSAFYFLPRVGNRGGAVALNILVVYAIVGAVTGAVLVFRPAVLASIFNNPGLAAYAPLVAGALFLGVASSWVELLALANGDVKSAAIFIVATNVVKTVLLSAAAIRFASVRAILLASMLHGLLQLIFLFGYLKRAFGSFVGRVDGELMRQQLAYAVPLGLAAWLYYLQMESHHYFVAHAFGAATYAIYAIGCASLPLTQMFGESTASVVIHRVCELHSQNRQDEVVILLSQAMRNLAAFYLPLYILLLVTGRDLIAVVFTPKFIASWPIFAINLTLVPLAILGVVNDAVIRSYTETRAFVVGLRLVLVALLLTALWLLTPRWGPIAAISIVVSMNVLERLIVAGRAAKALELRWRDVALLKGLLAIAATALVAGTVTLITRFALPELRHATALVVSVVVFGAVYVFANLPRTLEDAERAMADWPLTSLSEPMRRIVANMLVRRRRTRQSEAPGAKAA